VGDGVAELEQALTRLMRQASRPAFYRRLAEASGVPLDRSAYATLMRVSELGPARLTDVAEAVGIDISTASRQIRALETLGLVSRRADATDQRAFHVTLTAEGTRTLERTRRARQDAMRDMLAAWDDDDVGVLAALLERLTVEMARLGPGPARGPVPVAPAEPPAAEAGAADPAAAEPVAAHPPADRAAELAAVER
jgi:DNA-binding MarR family transcriptional regulator